MDAEVLVVGSGPAGLAVAAELSDPLPYEHHAFFAASRPARARAAVKACARRALWRVLPRAKQKGSLPAVPRVELGLRLAAAFLLAACILWGSSYFGPVVSGVLLSVPITELLPRLGLPALTAPFVLATWLVLAFGWLDERYHRTHVSPPA